jgi:hypothetical protein
MKFPMALIALVAPLLLSGCGSGGGSTASTPLQKNEALWRSRAVSSYRYTLNTGAFNAYAGHPVVVEVHNGATTSITPVESDFTADPAYFALYSTVEKLFSVIGNAQANGAEAVSAAYEPAYGFPANAFIDTKRQVADDEFGFTITDFQAL